MPTTAPYSYVDYGLAGDLVAPQTSGTFNDVPLEVINTSDVYVIRTVGTTKTTLSSSDFTVTESGSTLNVQITNPSSLDAGDIIRIGRTTEIGTKTRSFTDGSVLKASDLNEQNNQLLFAVQESSDGGIGSLPIDTDDKYDAGGKVIKNLASGLDSTDSVNKGYVDGLQLYGTAATDPQAWSFTTASGDVSGSHRVFTLSNPTPSATSDNLYIIEVDGVIQTPETYTVTETDGVYSLTLSNAAASVADGVAVSVRNFGVARNIFEQPMTAADASTPSFTIKRIGSQSANLQEWVDEASTPNVLASVNIDGDASFVDVAASGNATVGGTLGVTGNTTVTGSTTLSGGVSGNLNLLDGVIQYAGASLPGVRQVVEATYFYGGLTGGTQAMDHTPIGIEFDITPKNPDSTLFFFGFWTVRARDGGTASADDAVFVSVHKNSALRATSDADVGDIAFGTSQIIDGQIPITSTSGYQRYLAWSVTPRMSGSTAAPCTMQITGGTPAENTDQRYYSFIGSTGPYPYGSVQSGNGPMIWSTAKSHTHKQVFCIEIG